MANEESIEKSNGQVGTIEANDKNRLSKWESTILERYKQLETNGTAFNIEWASNNDKELKINLITNNSKAKNRQSYTLTIYRGENSKTIMVQSKSVKVWKDKELPRLRELVDGRPYEDIKWLDE